MRMTRMTRFNLQAQNFTLGVIIAGLLALAAYGTDKYPKRWDWTRGGRHTLAEQSVQVVKDLRHKVTATVYVQENGEQEAAAKELLDKYRVVNSDFSYRFIDPDLDPASARKEEVALYGTTILRLEDKKETVSELTEEALTNGLIRLVKGKKKMVRFLAGHGEHAIEGKEERFSYSQAVQLIKGEGYGVETLNLMQEEAVPEGTDVLILAGPRKPLFAVEAKRLAPWFEKGGRLLVMVDPNTEHGLETLLRAQGITFDHGFVVDMVARLAGAGPTTPLIDRFDNQHPITSKMGMPAILPEARGIILDKKEGLTSTALFFGASKGWLETDPVSEQGEVTYKEGHDKKGPILMGVSVEQEVEGGKTRLVAVGDSDFPADAYLAAAGNTALFLNMVRWLAEDESFIAIKPKKITDSTITISRNSAILLFWTTVVGMPLFLIGLGFLIWRARRNR